MEAKKKTTELELTIESPMLSKDPDVLAPSSDISYPPNPTFQSVDFPTSPLDISSVNKDVPHMIQHITILEPLIDQAKKFIPFLYSYRSIFRSTMKPTEVKDAINLAETRKFKKEKDQAVPPEVPLEGAENVNMEEYTQYRNACIFKQKYWESFKEHFKPTFDKLCELMTLCNTIASNMAAIMESNEYKATDVIFEKFIDLFSIIYNIDVLKLLKSGLTIDFSNYKRCFKAEDIIANQDLSNLPVFLSIPHVTLTYINEKLVTKTQVKGKEEKVLKGKALPFLDGLLKYCIRKYKKAVMTPEERSAVLLTIVSVLSFHGSSDSKNTHNIYDQSYMEEIWQILSENPIVPLYGENSCVPGYELPKSNGYFNNTKFQIAKVQKEIQQKAEPKLVINQINEFRRLYSENLSIASSMLHDNKVTLNGLYSVLDCLSKMSYAIQSQAAVKFICSAERPESEKKEKTGKKELKYDQAVKFNYSNDEKNALVELIGYIKTIAATVIQAEHTIQEYINHLIYSEVQEYIQNTIERPLVRARQTNEDNAIKLLEAIRDLFGDWGSVNPNSNLPSKTKQLVKHKINKKGLAVPSAHQLDILRIQLEAIIADDSPFTRKVSVFQLSHFRPKHVKQTSDFLANVQLWYPLLNFARTIKESTNLSFLWLRETSLDVDEELQFPVRSSLPFILAEHILNASDKPELHDSCFFPFELYNDAAYSAIYTFNSQYLYREVEAEVELCVDMIAFTFAETFYKFCRVSAAMMELPPECIGRILTPPMRYNVMVQQNKMEILGTPIDFNQVTTEKLNRKLQQELEGYVEMMKDLRYAPYIAHLVRVARTSHGLLCDNHLLMDDFDQIWQRARHFDSPLCIDSKLAVQIYNVLDFPHWRLNCISRRFLSSRRVAIQPNSTERWESEYAKIHQHETEYIGMEHIRAIIELLTPGELSFVINRLSERLDDQIRKFIVVYTKTAAAIRLLPAISKDDVVGYLLFNTDAYSSIPFEQVRSLFEGMRAIGNTIVFLWYLESELPPSEKSNSFMAQVMKTINQALLDNSQLFFPDSTLDLESVITHRAFPSLWSVLEFIICTPDEIKMKENEKPVVPLDYFGDGPIITAHIFITLCNQISLYKFDSICFRAIQLLEAEQTTIPNDTLSKFLFNASVAEQCRKFAELIATPFQVKFEE